MNQDDQAVRQSGSVVDQPLVRRGPKPPEPQKPGPKEQKEILSRIETGEEFPVVERKGEVGPEVKDWLTELETGEEIQLPQPVTDDSGMPIVKPFTPQKPQIILPLDEPTFQAGFKQSVASSFRWLVEWVKRVLLLVPERTEFKK